MDSLSKIYEIGKSASFVPFDAAKGCIKMDQIVLHVSSVVVNLELKRVYQRTSPPNIGSEYENFVELQL